MKEKLKRFWEKHGHVVLTIGAIFVTGGVGYYASKEATKAAIKDQQIVINFGKLEAAEVEQLTKDLENFEHKEELMDTLDAISEDAAKNREA